LFYIEAYSHAEGLLQTNRTNDMIVTISGPWCNSAWTCCWRQQSTPRQRVARATDVQCRWWDWGVSYTLDCPSSPQSMVGKLKSWPRHTVLL